ncbi:PREDICTED: histone deacetylase HDT1 isoform X2 [Tarenaya hassleriana]|uniref:histone deacetylase HDT1 isoform X2 n=1 Tax=Tarenaya hassleriana TaxID=28532 RepID=UPI00053C37B9|nr:PREDICTED: histone deacetylase HDT1 isoform X2 [Tarenaya hassleriana]
MFPPNLSPFYSKSLNPNSHPLNLAPPAASSSLPAMEFWGVEVKPGKPLKIEAEDGYMIHVSQAAMGESKNGKNECVPLYVKTGDQKFVMGTLASEKIPQVSLDLFFEQDFELSHNWKNGSVFILGYKSPEMNGGDEELYPDFDDSEDEEVPVDLAMIGKPNTDALKAKKEQMAKVEEAKEEDESDSEDDDEDDDDKDDESDSEDSDEMSMDGSDEEEETPKKVEPSSKKRPNCPAVATPASKKSKTETPQKTGKKGGNTATPNPSKSGKKGGRNPSSR